jgi:hypothetical protein
MLERIGLRGITARIWKSKELLPDDPPYRSSVWRKTNEVWAWPPAQIAQPAPIAEYCRKRAIAVTYGILKDLPIRRNLIYGLVLDSSRPLLLKNPAEWK